MTTKNNTGRFVVTHGEGRPKTLRYRAWTQMRSRCNDPNNPKWPRYGGRGITICKRWDRYEAFAEDMGPHPGKGWSIDRIDNNGAYEPTNCRWATQKTQQRNRTNTKLSLLTATEIRSRAASKKFYGRKQLAEEFGVSEATINQVVSRATWL